MPAGFESGDEAMDLVENEEGRSEKEITETGGSSRELAKQMLHRNEEERHEDMEDQNSEEHGEKRDESGEDDQESDSSSSESEDSDSSKIDRLINFI